MKTPHDIVIETLERIRLRISQNIDTTGTRASGRTQASMHIVSTPTGAMLVGRKYFQSVEVGNKTWTKQPKKLPLWFRDIIRQWIIDKGISVPSLRYKTSRKHKYTEQEMSLNQYAAQVSIGIIRNGTRLYREGGRTDIYSDVIAEEVDKLRKELVVSYTQTLSQTISGVFKYQQSGDATYQYVN